MNNRGSTNTLVFILKSILFFILKTIGIVIAWLLQLIGTICTTVGNRLAHSILNKN